MLKAFAIGSDIDGTMLHNSGDTDFLQWLEERGCPNAHAIYTQTHSWEEVRQSGVLTVEQFRRRYAEFLHNPSYSPPAPLPGAPAAFAALQRQCNIHLITSRSNQTKKLTLLHLRRHFACSFATATFNALGRKSFYAEQRRVIAYFEDNPEHALEVAQVAPVILIPSAASTEHVQHRNIIRTLAHSSVERNMSAEEWQLVWQETWREIPHLVHDLIQARQRTMVLNGRATLTRRKKLRTA